MEGELLSRDAPGEKDAAVLRGAFSDRRDQLHILSRAQRTDSRRLEPGDTRAIQAHAEGTQANHARQATARLRGAGPPVSRDSRDARAEAGRAAVSAAAKPEEGSCALRRVP